jgi:hypothetical protein
VFDAGKQGKHFSRDSAFDDEADPDAAIKSPRLDY